MHCSLFERAQVADTDNNSFLEEYFAYFNSFSTLLGGVNIRMFAVAILKLEYGFIRVGAVDDLYESSDMLDIHVLNGQLSVAF